MENKNLPRKKFLVWGIGLASLLTIPAFLRRSKKQKASGSTVKMLTQEGNLVEIAIADIPSKKKKIKPADIPAWVKRNHTLHLSNERK